MKKEIIISLIIGVILGLIIGIYFIGTSETENTEPIQSIIKNPFGFNCWETLLI